MKKILSILMLCATVLSITSCSDEIEVQHYYDYVLQTMPVPSELKQGESAEIRCTLIKQGNYSETEFTLRYFQTDGEGELRLDDGTVFVPNDRYTLDRDSFYLYYTSHCDDAQSIDIYIEDGNQVQKYTFSFANDSAEIE